MRLELARRLCASILLRFLFQLVVISASGGTSRRNSAVLTVQADSLGKRTSEDTCGTDVAKDRGSSVPTVTCVRKRSRTCIDTLGPNIEECAMYLPDPSIFQYHVDHCVQLEPQQQRCRRLGKKHGSNDSNRYNCPKCERTYRHLHHMLRHYKFECGSPPRFQCPYCEMRSKQSNNVYKHIRLKHPGSKLEVVVLQYDQQ